MKKPPRVLLINLMGLFIVTACSSTGESVIPITMTASPQPTATETRALPTPISPGKLIIYNELQVVMSRAEITNGYPTEFGSRREPPAGKQFLWIRIKLKNIGKNELSLPATEHFSVLYGKTEFKPTYGHRNEHTDYTSLSKTIYQNQEVDAWLRFDIPAAAELEELWFAFLPESSEVSISFSPADYPWGDHPIYLWTCTP